MVRFQYEGSTVQVRLELPDAPDRSKALLLDGVVGALCLGKFSAGVARTPPCSCRRTAPGPSCEASVRRTKSRWRSGRWTTGRLVSLRFRVW